MYVSHELGRIGENIIADYITKLGYKVVERNFACNQGEIDIIAKDKEELVFIEVKTRTDISYGEASEAVTDTKKRHLINSIKYYIYKQDLQARNHYYNISRYTKTPDILIKNIRRFHI